jgi:predicted transcriptional regulator of viral defense system
MEKLMAKLDRLETMVSKSGTAAKTRGPGSPKMSASDEVLEVIREAGDKGVGFAEVQDKTGFNEKKIRNILFRLNKLGRIKRKGRGIYMVN